MRSEPILVKCSIGKKKIYLELDTGASISILNRNMLKGIACKIDPCTRTAKDYNNNNIDFIGKSVLPVTIGNKTVYHEFFVVKNNLASLMGRDLCDKFNFKFSLGEIKNIKNTNLFSKFEQFLSKDFVSNVKEHTKIKIQNNVKPIFCKARSVPFRFRTLIKEKLEKLVKNGTLTKVNDASWASPIVPVLKASGDIRVCGDFSVTINKHLLQEDCPLPSIDSILSQVNGAKVFSQIDLESAYNQLPLDDESKQLCCINTQEGLFAHNFLPYGVASAPGLFMKFISKLLAGINNVIIYLDDVLVFSKTIAEHERILDQIFTKFENAGVKINNEKSAYFQDNVCYLGYVISHTGVSPKENKIKAIVDCPAPTNVDQLRSLLGLCNYYSRFIPKYSTVLAPLYKLLRKGSKFVWETEQKNAFRTIKELFQKENVLKTFNPNLETSIQVDASNYGIGGVLQQKHNNDWKPVHFISRTLNDCETRYATIDKEALAVYFTCSKFRNYLLGSKFCIFTDHKPLIKLLNMGSPVPYNTSSRLQRWKLRLMQYNYDIKHVPGRDNSVSDLLSRLPLPEVEKINEPRELILMINEVEQIISCDEIRKHSQTDTELKVLRECISNGWPRHTPDMLKQYVAKKDTYSFHEGCIISGNRIVIPQNCRKRVLETLHFGHPGVVAMKALARSLIYWPGVDSDIEKFCKSCNNCAQVVGLPNRNLKVSWPIPTEKWQRIHIDHFFYENHIFLIAVDPLTKYIECLLVKSVNSSDTINALIEIFSRQGLPNTIVSDNSTSFVSEEFKSFLEKINIKHITSPPRHPQSNGFGEAAVKTMKNLLKKNNDGTTPIKVKLSKCLMYYRSTPIAGKMSPSELLNSRRIITSKERMNPFFETISNSPYVKKKYNKSPIYEIGQPCLALSFSGPCKWLEAIVQERLGRNVYMVQFSDSGIKCKRHVDQLQNKTVCVKRYNEFASVNKSPRLSNTINNNMPSVNNNIVCLPMLPNKSSPVNSNNVSVQLPHVELRKSSRVKRTPAWFNPS